MRRDVKIGLAVGGIILVVLIAYVLSTPGAKSGNELASNTSNPNTTNANTGASTPAPTISDAASREHKPADELPATPLKQAPSAASEPVVTMGNEPPVTTQTPTGMGPVAMAPQAPATPPTDPFASAHNPTTEATASATADSTSSQAGSWDWGKLLETGKMQPLTAVNASERRAGDRMPSDRSNARPFEPTMQNTSPRNTNSTAMNSNGPTTHPAGARTHVVQKGESFATIAEMAYGSADYYPAVQRANPNVDPKRLRVGMTITLPDLSNQPARATSSSRSTNVDANKQYRVEPGDSLEHIAQKLYGDSQKWDRIYQANRQKIGPNPHRLKAETVLDLPEPPSH